MKSANHSVAQQSVPYLCPTCLRCFIDFGAAAGEDVMCVCGTIAIPQSLPQGIYELRPTEATGKGLPSPHQRPRTSESMMEADLGYGEAHGYGPAHGGPTGPGDAPAPVGGERETR